MQLVQSKTDEYKSELNKPSGQNDRWKNTETNCTKTKIMPRPWKSWNEYVKSEKDARVHA